MYLQVFNALPESASAVQSLCSFRGWHHFQISPPPVSQPTFSCVPSAHFLCLVIMSSFAAELIETAVSVAASHEASAVPQVVLLHRPPSPPLARGSWPQMRAQAPLASALLPSPLPTRRRTDACTVSCCTQLRVRWRGAAVVGDEAHALPHPSQAWDSTSLVPSCLRRRCSRRLMTAHPSLSC